MYARKSLPTSTQYAKPKKTHARTTHCSCTLLVFPVRIFMIDEQETQQYDSGAYPVYPARVLPILDHFAYQGQRYRQGETDGDDEW